MTLTLMRQLRGTSFEALKDPFAFAGVQDRVPGTQIAVWFSGH
jgi:hypothetical protein